MAETRKKHLISIPINIASLIQRAVKKGDSFFHLHLDALSFQVRLVDLRYERECKLKSVRRRGRFGIDISHSSPNVCYNSQTCGPLPKLLDSVCACKSPFHHPITRQRYQHISSLPLVLPPSLSPLPILLLLLLLSQKSIYIQSPLRQF